MLDTNKLAQQGEDMDTILNNSIVPILSLLGGVIATVVVARYYFLRTVEKSKKSLIPYIDFFSELLDGIDPEVRDSLSIKYHDIEVEDLIEVQFLVANAGEKPIRDLIKPLALEIPHSSKIMNVALLHISPKGREVLLDVDKNKNSIKFLFDLLNKDEFFVVKLLLNGKADIDDFKFTITVDDLPPVLETESLPYDLVEIEDDDESSEIEWGFIFVGIGFLIFGVMVFYLAMNVSAKLPELGDKTIIAYLFEVPLVLVAKWPTYMVGFFVILAGIGMMIGGVSDANILNKKKKLKLPKGIKRSKSLLAKELKSEQEKPEDVSSVESKKS
ncbi:hypothetical protein MNBD_GAMMA20-317 [hydrothermal vent metagenome]|uniref:Uncharacterized protein n=1 Tax=hydrothermal vent metagenome TaxID=652676 RepID=A0A3B1AMJ6_9ZZZZ